MLMSCAEYDAAGHFYCTASTARDKTFTTTNYEDNGLKKQDGG